MADYSPTIIAASLNDKELQESINKLVKYVDKGALKMAESFNAGVELMRESLQSLGKGVANGGLFNVARKQVDDVKKTLKETKVTFDDMAQATGKSTGRMTIMETYDMQIKLLIERLKEVRADIDIFNTAIGSGKATQVEWGQKGLKEANAEAERLMRIISNLESKRDALNAIMQPQGHTIQNYVQSLQKVNPELALLNQQYKNGTALLQQKGVAIKKSAQEEKQAAEESAAANAKLATYIEQGAERERQRRAEIQRTGQAAQESANQIMRSMYDQMSQDTETPITGLKELSDAIMKMQSAYYSFDKADRESPIGRALAEDIDRANKAITIVQKYNKELFAAQQAGGGEITKNSSLRTLQASLKDLTEQYNRLTVAEIDAGKDTGIRQKYQDISRAAQILQRNLSRPVSFEAAMGLDEGTLDNIAYKIRQLQAYKQGIDLTKPTAAQEIKDVDNAITKLEKDMQKYTSQSKSVLESNNALARSWNYMRNRLAFYLTVGAAKSFINELLEVRSQYEMLDRSIGILIDDARKGSEIFRQLNSMALKSPFTTMELGAAAKQLVAFNIAGKDVVDTTKRIGDMAAAVGIPMERLTYALGQVKTYGYLNSRDARIFLSAGIPIIQMLTDMYNRQRDVNAEMVTATQVREMMAKRLISYADVMKVVNEATSEGGRFFNYQEKLAGTLKVQLANLTLAWNNMLNEIGKSQQGGISAFINSLKVLLQNWRTVVRVMMTGITVFGTYRFVSALAASSTLSLIKDFAMLATSANGAGFAVAFLTRAIKSIPFAGVASAIIGLLSYFVFFNDSVGDSGRKIQELTESMNELKKQFTETFVKGSLSNNFNEQLDSLRKMLDKAKTDLHVIIPVDIEDVNETNIREKLKATQSYINEYIATTTLFSKAAIKTDLADYLTKYANRVETVYQELLVNKAKFQEGLIAIGRYNDALLFDKKEAESELEYVLRVYKNIEFWRKTAFKGAEVGEVGNEIKSQLAKLLLVQEAYKGKLQKFYKELDRMVDTSTLSVEEKQSRLLSAIEQFANDNNLSGIAVQEIKRAINVQYKVNIPLVVDGKDAEDQLLEWQKRLQEAAKSKNIVLSLFFTPEQTEAEAAQQALDQYKKALEELETLKRKKKAGTATQEDIDKQVESIKNLREQARLTGADLESLNKGGSKKDVLGDSLTNELQIIQDIQKLYKEYTKAGVDSETAKTAAAKEYQKTLEQTNKELSKFGVQGLTGEQIATMDLRAMRDYYQSILDKVQSSPKAVEALEKAIRNLNVEITKTGQKTIIDSLNSELSKIKDEYELAVELDANPELGGVFADMMGLSKEELDKLPRDFEGVVRRLQTIVDNKLGMGAFDVRSNLNKDVFDKWVKSSNLAQDGEKVKALKALTDYANKVRQDETKKQIEDWNMLLEKYAEYEYKRTQILQAYEREMEIALKKGATQEVLDAIKQGKDRDLASLDFEQFQKSPEWITATGDLATLTDKALGMLIDDLEEYKKKAKYLDPKQIKQINNALKNLHREQRKGNPFLAIANAMDEAKNKVYDYQQQIDELGKVLDKQNKKIEAGEKLTDDETKTRLEAIDSIKQLRKEQEEVGKVSATTIVEALQGMLSSVNQVTGGISEMFAAFGNTKVSENIQKVTQVLDKAASFAAMGAQVGDGWGAAIGGIIGGVMGAMTAIADEISGNADITRAVEQSELSLKRLEISYKRLDNAIENAYGTGKYAYEQLAIANKKLQLAELERQLRLEQSRNSKNYDKEKIISLQEQIEDLKLEIKDTTKSITEDLLGITSVGDAAENMVMQMITAFRAGDDYMGEFSKSFEDMINNMIMKTIASKVIGDKLDKLFKEIEKKAKKRGGDYLSEIKDAEKQINDWENWIAEYTEKVQSFYIHVLPTKENNYEIGYGGSGDSENMWKIAQGYVAKQKWEDYLDYLRKLYEQAIEPRPEDISELRSSVELMQEEVKSSFETWMNAFGIKFGMDAESQSLSNLQQGIQGITEDTAGSIEAYMNGVSQQVYLHSDLLTQIRDAVVGFNLDVQLGVQSQMLLQLQNNYIVIQSMQSMMENWTTPAGNGIRVEVL